MLTAVPSLPIAALSQYFFGPLLFLVSLFMILIILVQRGKGGGLTGALGGPGGQSVFGSKAGDLFTRITVVLATVWIFLLAFAVWWYNEDSLSSALAGTEENVPSMTARPGATATDAGGMAPNVGEVAPIGPETGDLGTGDIIKGLSGSSESTPAPADATGAAPVEKAAETTPMLELPAADTPKIDVPTVDAAKIDAPKIDTPAVDAPAVDAPKADVPVVETPPVAPPAAPSVAPTLEAPSAPAK